MAWDHRLARLIAKPIARTGVHPNAVTTAGMLLGLGSGVLFALGAPVAANVGAALFMLAAFTDHVDGEVARSAGKTSTFGHYYDHVAVLVTYCAMFVGAGIGFSGGALGGWAVAFGVLAGVSVATIMSLRLVVEFRRGKEAIRQGNILGFEPEDALYLVGPVTWLGAMPPFLVAAGVGAPAFLVWVLWRSRRSAALAEEDSSRS
ncbi:MAG: CDP-alcohol phosphatidyltransferase family protein [Alphaproteobacteria bacterium]